MVNEGRVILCCGECGNYNFKAHRCMICQNKESDPRNPFYDDCPLPKATNVIRCKDCDNRVYIDMGGEIGVVGGCAIYEAALPEDFYCAYGKREVIE